MSNFPRYQESDLATYFLNQEFIEKTVKQIQKNLNQFGYEFLPVLNGKDPLKVLLIELRPILQDFIQQDSEKFMAYLYVVDLNEKKLHQDEYGKDYIENVCYKIIRREAQKIFFQFVLAEKKL